MNLYVYDVKKQRTELVLLEDNEMLESMHNEL